MKLALLLLLALLLACAPGTTPTTMPTVCFAYPGVGSPPTPEVRCFALPTPTVGPIQHFRMIDDFSEEIRAAEAQRAANGTGADESELILILVETQYKDDGVALREWFDHNGIGYEDGVGNHDNLFRSSVPVLLLNDLADVSGVRLVRKPSPPEDPYAREPVSPIPLRTPPTRSPDARFSTDRTGGMLIFTGDGQCHSCHFVSEDVYYGYPRPVRSDLPGPELTNIGSEAEMRMQGVSARDYLRESISNHDTYLVQSCVERGTYTCPPTMTGPLMDPANFTDDDVEHLVAFLLEQR